MFEAGGLEYCDAISYHPYNFPNPPETNDVKGSIEGNMFRSKELMRQYGGEKPVWITEYGWVTGLSTGLYAQAVPDKAQASFLVRTYLLSMAFDVEKMFWYDFQNDGSDLHDREDNFGLIDCWEKVAVPYGAKQSYVALTALTNKLRGVEFLQEYKKNIDTRAYKFYRAADDREIVVMYNINGAVEVSLEGETGEMDAFDMFGNPVTVTSLSEDPVYLVGSPGQFDPKELETISWHKIKANFVNTSSFFGIGAGYKGIIQTRDGEECYVIGGESGIPSIPCYVDDTYIFGGINNVALTVKYFDEGAGSFHVTYDAADNTANNKTDAVELKNSKKWQTAVFNIENAGFANRLDGADFKIETDPESEIAFGGVEILKLTKGEIERSSAVLSDVMRLENAMIRLGDNPAGFTYVEKDGRVGLYTENTGGSIFIYVDVNDDMIYDGVNSVKVSIEYFDEGEGFFCIAYDSVNSPWEESEAVQLENTLTWKTAVFELDDAKFSNRSNGGDFRIALWAPKMGASEENVCFGGVTVEKAGDKQNSNEKNTELTDMSGHWSEEQVTALVKRGVVSGYSDNTFKPEQTVQAGEFIKTLILALNVSLPEGNRNSPDVYINKAKELGLVLEGEFADYGKDITKGEILKTAARILGSDTTALRLMDTGEEGGFNADSHATRAEAAVIVFRMLEK